MSATISLDLIPVRALNQVTYCPRLYYLEYVEALMTNNEHVESGQFVLNKRLCWQPLNLAWFYNDHSDYYYRYGYGDKHTFEVAWARCARPFVMWQPKGIWVDVAYLHAGPDRRPLFVHRCSDKFRFDNHTYTTSQNDRLPSFYSSLPMERECWEWMSELAGLMGRTLPQGKATAHLRPSPRCRGTRP